jgi:hypothetical protein
MARLAVALLAAVLLASPAAAQQPRSCAVIGKIVEVIRASRKDACRPASELASRLAQRFAESPSAAHPYCDGRFVLVLWASDWAWTVVWRSAATSSACVVAAGLRRSAGT